MRLDSFYVVSLYLCTMGTCAVVHFCRHHTRTHRMSTRTITVECPKQTVFHGRAIVEYECATLSMWQRTITFLYFE